MEALIAPFSRRGLAAPTSKRAARPRRLNGERRYGFIRIPSPRRRWESERVIAGSSSEAQDWTFAGDGPRGRFLLLS